MSVNIESVSLNPQTVTTGQTFILSVKIQVSTYERLKKWLWGTIKKFTWKNVENDLLK